MVSTQDLSLAYGLTPVIEALDLAVEPGRITTLIGPNGCGKSTLLKALARLLAPRSGAVLLDGEEIRGIPSRVLAQRLGFLAQHAEVPESLTVGDLVRRGRYPHRGPWEPMGPEDEAAVNRALEQCGLTPWVDRPVDELSGGQRQRAWIALALAQQTPLVLLDEPTTFLDPRHQTEVLDLLVALNRDQGTTFVLVLHDLSQAARISHRVVALAAGRMVADGPPDLVLEPRVLERVFGVPFDHQGPVPGVGLDRPPRTGGPRLEARGLAAGYGGRPVVGPIDLGIGPGLTVILGPNGCGKSTLLRTLAGLQNPLGGEARIDDRPVSRWTSRALAARRAFVRQDSPLPAGFTVGELAHLGAHHRRGLWGSSDRERPAVARALAALDLGGLERRPLEHQSGGQRQRVWLALALVQNAGLILLDEPTSFLDPRHQRDLLDALWTLTREAPVTVVAILHEPNLARRYADRIIDFGAGPEPSGPPRSAPT